MVGGCDHKKMNITSQNQALLDKLDSLKPDNLAYYETPGFLDTCHLILEEIEGQNYEKKELRMLELVPKKLGYYYLIFRFDALWGNGGTQAVALDHGLEENKILLEKTAVAMQFYGFSQKAKLIKELIPVAYKAQVDADKLNDREASDEEFQPIWDKLDSFDQRYEDTDRDRNIYRVILDDLKKSPSEYMK